jgi:predicted acylesterase/phospholipase RssA/CRP-like cAMP-binding protein
VTDQSFSHAVFKTPSVLEQVLRGYPLFRGFTSEDLERVTANARVVARSRGEVAASEGRPLDRLLVVLRGRIEIAAFLPGGTMRVLGEIGPGDHLGEVGLLTGEKLSTRATATTDVLLLELDRADFEALFRALPVFAENLLRSVGLRLASTHATRARRPLPGVIGIAGGGPRAAGFLAALAQGLEERRAPFAILGGAGAAREPLTGTTFESQAASGQVTDKQAVVQRIAELRSTRDVVLLVLEAELRSDDPRLVPCEELWALVDPGAGESELRALDGFLARKRTLQGRTRLVWCLREGERPLTSPRPDGLLQPEFRAFLPAEGLPRTRREKLSMRRVVGHLEGQRIGLALGGGGARGLAHCGVLRVIDEEGIAIDRIAGTSMGALVGFLYAAGTPPDDILLRISGEARTPLALQLIPRGRYLNFWLKARTGGFERSIRKYHGKITFPELDIPLQTVASDLLQGEQVVRESRDCVDAVIESINLPIFSRPILRDGRALVDGGVLNNLPSDLLLAQQIETVVAVDVLSNNGESPAEPRPIGMLESLLRIAELQHERLTAQSAGQADLLLRVDAGRFSMTDFSLAPAKEIAALGESAARRAIARLRSLVPPRWRGHE